MLVLAVTPTDDLGVGFTTDIGQDFQSICLGRLKTLNFDINATGRIQRGISNFKTGDLNVKL